MSNNQNIADIMDKLIAGKLAEANVEQIAEFSEYARRKLEIAERLAAAVERYCSPDGKWQDTWEARLYKLAREFKAVK